MGKIWGGGLEKQGRVWIDGRGMGEVGLDIKG